MKIQNRTQADDSHKLNGVDMRPQLDKFKDLARELGCDEDEAAFDERLKKMATTALRPKSEASEN